MTSRSLNVLVATPLGRSGKGGIDRIMDGVRVELAKRPYEDITIRFGRTRGGGHVLFFPFFLVGFIGRMAALCLIGKCDVLHVNVAPRGSNIRKALICQLARLMGVKTIVHLHGSGYDEFWRAARPAMQRRIRRMFSLADRVIVLGTTWRNFVLDEHLVASERLILLPNATPIPSLSPSHGGGDLVRILFLGVHSARKGTLQLVEALGKLKHRLNWCAVLAGNGEVAKTRDEIARLGLADRILVPGWVGPMDTEQLLADSDILVLPSFSENLPMSVIEGMAAGLAVVTTPVGATPDIIHDNETGLLVPPGDVNALAAALERLVIDESLRARLGKSARVYHRAHLEMSGYAEKLVRLWRQVATNDVLE